jgi:inorganic phosphate transporter, PiT family
VTALLVILAVGFAWSIGAHYTGACMGMPHALRAISAWRALLLMAPLAFLGALLASHGVEHRVGHGLTAAPLSLGAQVVVVGVAFAVTTLFNRSLIPTSTIQILVFTVVGVALATGTGVQWSAIGTLAIIWVSAPLVAVALGFVLTRLLSAALAKEPAGLDWLGVALIVVGGIASFAMGANDVANASGPLVGAGVLGVVAAGAVGGAGLAAGVLTWGKPLLHRVAFQIVDVDRAMATSAQLVQGGVILTAVAFGYFTSMNQALVGAMGGAGLARGRETVRRQTILLILAGWLVGPTLAIAGGYVFGLLA